MNAGGRGFGSVKYLDRMHPLRIRMDGAGDATLPQRPSLELLRSVRDRLTTRVVSWDNYVSAKVFSLISEAHQQSGETMVDRYPEIFTFCARYAEDAFRRPKILSFGCSTGEECLTLSQYFGDGQIIGTDINVRNLRKARARIANPSIEFVLSRHNSLLARKPFDIIFCMSVLCRWRDARKLTNCRKAYPFEKFDAKVRELDSLLTPNGLLVIYNSNFRFADSSVYDRYQAVEVAEACDSGFVDKFGSDNVLLADQSYGECVFRKREP